MGLLDLVIHESLHACLWDLDEEAVTETAWDIARLLQTRQGPLILDRMGGPLRGLDCVLWAGSCRVGGGGE